MSKVIVDDPGMVARLNAAQGRTEIYDSSGLFVPMAAPPNVYRGVKSPLSPEERERLIREEGPSARPLSDFWEDMKRKHPDEFK